GEIADFRFATVHPLDVEGPQPLVDHGCEFSGHSGFLHVIAADKSVERAGLTRRDLLAQDRCGYGRHLARMPRGWTSPLSARRRWRCDRSSFAPDRQTRRP